MFEDTQNQGAFDNLSEAKIYGVLYKYMNTTNADYFTFNVDNSIFLTGQTGTGKSVLQDKLIDRLVKSHTPETLQFVLLDMTQIDFGELRENHTDFIMKYVTGIDSDKPFELLEEMADLSEKRASEQIEKPLLFICIEECNLAAADQNRFVDAVTKINNNAKQANMKLIFSTSRPAIHIIPKRLLETFDLILAGHLASEIDAKNLGIPYVEALDKYSFIIAQKSEREHSYAVTESSKEETK